MKIVIIEDERDLGVLMRNFLIKQLDIQTPDAAIRVVASLTEGLDCVRVMSPDWIFIDNNLPDGKGVQAIRTIKDVYPDKLTKVVMMSAMTNLREEAFRNGADFFLDKPISFVEVKNIFTTPGTDPTG
nr:response regulator [uncultured Dyadobacter sp.]